jgi:hypothetical protein
MKHWRVAFAVFEFFVIVVGNPQLVSLRFVALSSHPALVWVWKN